jgi:hypothetical protein
MRAGQKHSFSTIYRVVRKYQRQMVLLVNAEWLFVPFVRRDEFSKLSRHPFLPVE